MTGGQLTADALEITQTRNLTSTELRTAERDWSRLVWESIGDDGWYRFTAYLAYGFIGFLVLTMAMSVFAIDQEHFYLPAQLAVALVGTVVCWVAAERRTRVMQQRLFRNRYREGDRYVLGERGIEIVSPMARYELLWGGIAKAANDGQRLVLLVGNSGVLFLFHTAFSGQDAKTFCSELVSRWQAHRDSSRLEPAR